MKAPKRITLICNTTLEWGRLLKAVAARYPEAAITVLLPPHAKVLDEEEAIACAIRHLPLSGKPHHVAQTLRLLHQTPTDLLVLRFESLRLRLLAARSGALQAECWTEDGRAWPLAVSVRGTLAQLLHNRLRGYARLLRVLASVLCRPVLPR